MAQMHEFLDPLVWLNVCGRLPLPLDAVSQTDQRHHASSPYSPDPIVVGIASFNSFPHHFYLLPHHPSYFQELPDARSAESHAERANTAYDRKHSPQVPFPPFIGINPPRDNTLEGTPNGWTFEETSITPLRSLATAHRITQNHP